MKSRYNLGRRRRAKRKTNNNLGKNKGEYYLVDRISQLPDELLVSILSLLPLKEAAATSFLSRRWQYVWVSTMNLNFDARFDVGNTYSSFYKLTPELRNQERHRYVNWVNRVVEQHTAGTTIKRFRVCFDVDCVFKSSIDKWIQFAMNKRVQILELEFRIESDDPYPFSQELLGLEKESALKPKHLDPEIPSLHSCGYNIGFKFLKVLHFRQVGVTGEVLEYFLSNCPVLERLSVNCATESLVSLRVVGPSVALKYLAIICCYDVKSIEICDVNLVSFIYEGLAINLLLSNVPLLVEVSISEMPVDCIFWYKSIELPFTQLSCCLSQLEILTVDIDLAVYNQNYVFPILANLKHLELIVQANYLEDHRHLASFLKASPYLQKLVLKVELSTIPFKKSELERVSKCHHNYIKVVEIVGYRARPSVVQHVMFLIKSIAALEKIVIDPVRRWCWPDGMYRGIEQVKEEVEARDHAMQHLKVKVPSTIEFVCL